MHEHETQQQQQQQGYMAVSITITKVSSEELNLESGETLLLHPPSLIVGEGFIFKGTPGLLLFLPFIFLFGLLKYQLKHLHKFNLLGLFTLLIILPVGITWAKTDGKFVPEALISTFTVVSYLTGYAFWASKKGKDFSCLGSLLPPCLSILMMTSVILMLFPLGSTTNAICGGIGAVIFSAYILYDTHNLIKRLTYDVGTSVTLHLNIVNLFLFILRVLTQINN